VSVPGRRRRVGYSRRDAERRDLLRSWWVLLTLVPFGWLSWAAFAYAGARAGRRDWLALAGLYLALSVAGLVLFSLDADRETWLRDAGGWTTLLSWFAAIGHAFSIRPDFIDSVSALEDPYLRAGRERLERRRIAARLARTDPVRARELGVGRPDLADAFDGELTDLNNAPASAIAELPRIDAGLAAAIVAARERTGGFGSLADLDMELDLPAETVERLRELVVFLPPGG
jgi:hypothetical protein